MIVSPLWFSLSCFVFPFLVLVLVLCVRVCLFAAVLSVLWSAWWGLWAEALVVQKSGSSSVLAEGKPESCGKMLQLEWLVWQLRLYMLQTMVWNCHSVFVLNRVTAKEFSLLLIIVTLSYSEVWVDHHMTDTSKYDLHSRGLPCAITVFNIAVTIWLEIDKQMLKCA